MTKAAKVETLAADGHHEFPEFDVPVSLQGSGVRASVVDEPKSIKPLDSGLGAAPRPISVTPMDLIQAAVAKDFDIDKLTKLLDLQERWEKNEAKKAYVAAMKAFKAETPEILRNRTASIESKREGAASYGYAYATLDNVCEKLCPALSKHGLTHRWKVQQMEGKVRVTCVITHELGHSEEESTLEAGADQTGGKNNLQAYGSTLTYLERYTLLAACGVAVKGQDTDAIAPLEGLDQALKAIAEAPDTSALQNIYKNAANMALLAKNGKAIVTLAEARDKRKKELTATEAA